MPIYCFVCVNPNCEINKFEASAPMCESHLIPSCPECGKMQVERDFWSQCKDQYNYMGVRTVGAQRDRNTDKFSDDHKHHLENKNKEHNTRIENAELARKS